MEEERPTETGKDKEILEKGGNGKDWTVQLLYADSVRVLVIQCAIALTVRYNTHKP